jgi:hypothetical protein
MTAPRDSDSDPLGHRPFHHDREALELCAAFLDTTLPKAAWTHRAHLTVGLWHLVEFGLAESRIRVPVAIRRYNAAVGTEDTPTSGYHETITQLYLSVIDRFRLESEPAGFGHWANLLYERLGDRKLPLLFYSEDRLWSVEARTTWVAPDKGPAP